MSKYLLLSVVILTAGISAAHASAFTNSNASLPGVFSGCVAWADYDNDGYLDLLVSGYLTNDYGNCATYVYRRSGSTFTRAANLGGVMAGRAAWSDANCDGRPDFAIAGYTGTGPGQLTLYRGTGSGFSGTTAGQGAGAVAWGDYDNDGDPDCVAAGGGSGSSGPSCKIYRNDGETLVDSGMAFLNSGGSAAWGDYDNDGDLDLATTSPDGGAIGYTNIFRNDGGKLVDTNAYLAGCGGVVAWGDYDSDGDLDLLVVATAQYGTYTPRTFLYRNDSGKFTLVDNPFPALRSDVWATWVDYDNDGDLDVAMSGFMDSGSSNVRVFKLFRNDHGAFAEVTDTGVTPAFNTCFSWGDYDNDGDLDLLMCGDEGSGTGPHIIVTKIYVNNTTNINTAPQTPPSPQARCIGRKVIFSWGAASDVETPAPALTYNLRVGRTAGADDVVPSLSDASGRRKVPVQGNVGESTGWTLNNLPDGTYYWSVQTVDTGMAGSAWAAGQTLIVSTKLISGTVRTTSSAPVAGVTVSAGGEYDSRVTGSDGTYALRVPTGWSGTVTASHGGYIFSPPQRSYTGIGADSPGQDFTATRVLEPTAIQLPGITYGDAEWGDYDNDGDLDLVIMGTTTSWYSPTPIAKLFRNNSGSLVEVATTLKPLYYGSIAWGDYDRDGDLDLVVGGWESASKPFATIYRNDNGVFVDTHAVLPRMDNPRFAWGDYDNDGDLDLVMVAGSVSKIYRNDGGTFVDSGLQVPSGTSYANSVSWADYDNDGDLDLAVGGDAADVYLYRNDGGTFTRVTSPPNSYNAGTSVWADYDGDGDLDLLLSGIYGSTKLYQNNGGTFTLAATMTGIMSSSFAWGDYDNDGDLDLVFSGDSLWGGTAAPLTKLYRNDGGILVDTRADLIQVWNGRVAWGDYDGDGKLDLLVAGDTGTSDALCTPTTRLYHNSALVTNSRPSPPVLLQPQVNGRSVLFSWNRGADAETPSSGLSYNLRVGTTSGGNDICSGAADAVTGFDRQPGMGNVQLQRAWTLKNLANGVYYWSVQSIDNAFAGSPWAVTRRLAIGSVSIASAKMIDDGAPVASSGVIVTAVFGDSFYVETDDRSSGMRITKAGHGAVVGARVDVAGTMQTTADGERFLAADTMTVSGSGSIAPVMLTNKALGGGPASYVPETGAGQRGVEDGSGLNTIGLLVSATGRVTSVGDDFFYIDDGTHAVDYSIRVGVRVQCRGLVKPASGDYVSVTGISSITSNRGKYYRGLLPRTDSDIVRQQ